jgi:hypothetical protein
LLIKPVVGILIMWDTGQAGIHPALTIIPHFNRLMKEASS